MANPTTNFGWQMPTSTDLVTDLPADFEVFGQAVDTSLVDLKGGTTGQVLSKASNTDMDFTWVAQDDSNAIQNAIVDAKGDLITATAADTPARLAVGANNTVLTADSSTATGLKWATPKIVQIVAVEYATATSNSTTSFADTGLTATITPTSASNKILVMWTQAGLRKSADSASNGVVLKLLRTSTQIAYAELYGHTGTAISNVPGNAGATILDSPATTSAVTYKTQFCNNTGSASVTVQYQSATSTLVLMEVTP